MKKCILQFSLFACLFFAGLSVGKAGITIQLTSLFRYPVPDTVLITAQINDSNILVGYVNSGVEEGFYAHKGQFSAPFRAPGDTGGQTFASGINNQRHICGNYWDSASFGFKGFIRIGERYFSFVAPDQGQTFIYSINDADNFVGFYSASSYSMIDGVFTTLPIPYYSSAATGINNLNQIVGEYTTEVGSLNFHGYFLDTDGSLTTYDFPSAERTEPTAINDAGLIVGTWSDGVASHGFLLKLPSTFISYDVPDTVNTILTGINNNGMICGPSWKENKPNGFTAQILTDN